MNLNLAYPLYLRAQERPDSVALNVANNSYTYGQLTNLAKRTAFDLGSSHKVGVLASRSLGAYVGLLGAAWCGALYVPLDPKTPDERLKCILSIIDLDALIVDESGQARLNSEVRKVAPDLIIDASRPSLTSPIQTEFAPRAQESGELAYVLFTSGTTGVPKGVMVSVGSVHHFLSAMQDRCRLVETDRVSQTSALVFDVSVFEMFATWSAGASLHVIPAGQLMAPARFISDHQLTIWSSVPSIAAFMRKMNMLKPGAFPSLRYSVFAGEALPYSLAKAWQNSAFNSVVENLYGPTEATVYCLGATVGPQFPPTPGRDTVPSGFPLPGVAAAIVDDKLRFLGPGNEGQLAISGEQLAQGYYGEPDLTKKSFPTIAGKRWYLTGDSAFLDERGVFHHLGRIDHQVKILGQRVELEEIEAHLRAVCDSDEVAAIGWPIQDGMVMGLVAFTGRVKCSQLEIRSALAARVPVYMMPSRIIQMDALPLGVTGKIDRTALVRHLNESTPTESSG